jgi:transcriptional regulator with XRE-family HTH domain
MTMSEPTGRARELGAHLRKYREAAGLNESQVARTLRWSASTVCRLEGGYRRVSDLTVARCMSLFGVYGEEQDEMVALAREVDDYYRLQAHNHKLPDELRTLIHHENTARAIETFEPSLIPGILQTEDYARALFRWADLIPTEGVEPRIQARMNRQQLLYKPNAPQFTCFVHETALKPPMIGAKIMHDQLMKLMFACDWQDCKIRIVPAKAGPHGTLGGPFMFMSYAEYKPIVYVENVSTSAFLEKLSEIDTYKRILNRLTSVALDEGQSRELITSLAT